MDGRQASVARRYIESPKGNLTDKRTSGDIWQIGCRYDRFAGRKDLRLLAMRLDYLIPSDLEGSTRRRTHKCHSIDRPYRDVARSFSTRIRRPRHSLKPFSAGLEQELCRLLPYDVKQSFSCRQDRFEAILSECSLQEGFPSRRTDRLQRYLSPRKVCRI
jgi:hypothetical protein